MWSLPASPFLCHCKQPQNASRLLYLKYYHASEWWALIRYNLGQINLESRNIDLRKACSVGAVRLFAIFLANYLQDCHGMLLYIQKIEKNISNDSVLLLI